MDGGDLQWVLTIKRAVTERTGMGTKAPTWTDFLAGVRAKKTDVSDGERDVASQRAASITCRFLIRWSADRASIDERDQLECDGVRYMIVAVKEPKRGRELEISAKALVGVGA